MRKVEIIEPLAICLNCFNMFDFHAEASLEKENQFTCNDCINNTSSAKQ